MLMMAEIRRRARHVVGPVLGACLVGYFAYHAVHGDRGLIAWWRLTQQIDEAEATVAKLAATREGLERRVALLRPDSLDPDMLDERARHMLNLVGPDEVVMFDNWDAAER